MYKFNILMSALCVICAVSLVSQCVAKTKNDTNGYLVWTQPVGERGELSGPMESVLLHAGQVVGRTKQLVVAGQGGRRLWTTRKAKRTVFVVDAECHYGKERSQAACSKPRRQTDTELFSGHHSFSLEFDERPNQRVYVGSMHDTSYEIVGQLGDLLFFRSCSATQSEPTAPTHIWCSLRSMSLTNGRNGLNPLRAVELKASRDRALAVAKRRLAKLAESMGGMDESTAEPARLEAVSTFVGERGRPRLQYQVNQCVSLCDGLGRNSYETVFVLATKLPNGVRKRLNPPKIIRRYLREKIRHRAGWSKVSAKHLPKVRRLFARLKRENNN